MGLSVLCVFQKRLSGLYALKQDFLHIGTAAKAIAVAAAEIASEAANAAVQGLPKEDQRELLLSVPFIHMSNILQALPGQACMDALLSIGAPLCKDLLLSMPSAASKKLLHAASLTDLAKLIKVNLAFDRSWPGLPCHYLHLQCLPV